MASNHDSGGPSDTGVDERGRFRQPPEKRSGISEEGRKWLEENAEAIKDWNAWVEKNGLPLDKYRAS